MTISFLLVVVFTAVCRKIFLFFFSVIIPGLYHVDAMVTLDSRMEGLIFFHELFKAVKAELDTCSFSVFEMLPKA